MMMPIVSRSGDVIGVPWWVVALCVMATGYVLSRRWPPAIGATIGCALGAALRLLWEASR